MRQRRKVGDIYEMNLGDGTNCYAMALEDAAFAFLTFGQGAKRALPISFKGPSCSRLG